MPLSIQRMAILQRVYTSIFIARQQQPGTNVLSASEAAQIG